jgi:hypothetical protein
LKIKYATDFISPSDNGDKAWKKKKHTAVTSGSSYNRAQKTTTYHKHFLLFTPACHVKKTFVRFNMNKSLRELVKLTDKHVLSQKLKDFFAIMSKAPFEQSFSLEKQSLINALIKCDDFNLARSFFDTIIGKFKSAIEPETLASCLTHYGVDILESAVCYIFGEPYDIGMRSAKNVIDQLLQDTQNGVSLSRQLLNLYFKPILTNESRMKAICEEANVSFFYYDYIQILLKVDAADLLELFVNGIVRYSNLEASTYDHTLNRIAEQMTWFANSKVLRSLFQAKIEWLHKKFPTGKPAFTWSMPKAQMRHHREVEKFLRSDEVEMHYDDFHDERDASRFMKEYKKFNSSTGYSVKFEFVQEKGDWSFYVLITKTKRYFNYLVSEYESTQAEIGKLNKVLEQFQI